MVKFTVLNRYQNEIAKFTRELNTYGFDGNGIGEELLFPIRLNKPSGGNQDTDLATYLVKYMEFEETSVTIKKLNDKEWFQKLKVTIKSEIQLSRYRVTYAKITGYD